MLLVVDFIFFLEKKKLLLLSTVAFCLFVFHILQEPEPIDWDYYRKGIGTRLVDMYKEHYESMFLNSMVNALNMHIFQIS